MTISANLVSDSELVEHLDAKRLWLLYSGSPVQFSLHQTLREAALHAFELSTQGKSIGHIVTTNGDIAMHADQVYRLWKYLKLVL